MGKGKNNPRRQANVAEACEIVAQLLKPGVTLSAKELAFVTSVGQRMKRIEYVSGAQLGWLRGLQKRNWGAHELAEKVG